MTIRNQTVLAMLLVGTTALAGLAHAGKSKRVEVDSFRANIDTMPFGDDKGRFYVKLNFDVTFKKKPRKGTAMGVKSKCRVGSKSKVDKSIAFADLEDVEADETVSLDAAPFISKGLATRPASCEFTLKWGKMFGSQRKVATYCWTPEATTEGKCKKK